MAEHITHVGLSDESNWKTGRFRSLGLITLQVCHLKACNSELQKQLDESNVQEFKWQNLNGAKERYAAQKMYRFAITKACARQLRADVLVWDTKDSRHTIVGRDDIANLNRMSGETISLI